MIEVTIRSMRDDLFTIVKRAGADHVYERPLGERDGDCLYWHNGEPGCIFGHWFALRGITPEVTAACSIHNSGDNITAALSLLRNARKVSYSDAEHLLEYAAQVQTMQDDHAPWGMCLTEGDAHLRRSLSQDKLTVVLL